MRRSDRQVVNPQEIENIIRSCHCCRIGFYDNGKIYIVPLNFGYEKRGEKRYFYFHSAAEGRKIDLIKTGLPVGFEMDTSYQLTEAETACGFSAKFQSIIGTGNISLIETAEEKIHALEQIMFHNTGNGNWKFSEKLLSEMCVFMLEVVEISCKQHQ